MDSLKRDFAAVYVCENCKVTTPPPTHCGKAMEVEVINESIFWTCWKGEHPPCCGRESHYGYENCCETPKLKIHLSTILS